MRRPRQRVSSWLILVSLGSLTSACGLLLKLPEAELVDEDSSSVDDAVFGEDAGQGGLAAAGGPTIEPKNPHCSACSSSGGSASGGADTASGGGASGGADAASGGAAPVCLVECDCDGDGALAMGACGGNDCDDDDAQVHPGQIEFFSERASNASIGFDYDCSGGIERDPAQGGDVVLDCGLLTLLACDQAPQAFVGILPPCGTSGPWGKCRKIPPLNLTCGPDILDESVTARCH